MKSYIKPGIPIRRISLLAIAAAITAAPVYATTDNWTGGAGNGNFNTA